MVVATSVRERARSDILRLAHQHRRQLATALIGVDEAYPPFVI